VLAGDVLDGAGKAGGERVRDVVCDQGYRGGPSRSHQPRSIIAPETEFLDGQYAAWQPEIICVHILDTET
jgi:hypothetical protein